MDLGLKDRVAIVAAASQGLGKAVAKELALEGCRVAICSRNKEAIEGTAKDIRQATGGEVLGVQANLTDPEQIKRFVQTTADKFGTVHVLFANAGGPPPGQFVQLTDDQWEATVQLTLMSTIRLCREVLPYMQRQKWGRIILSTSYAVKNPIDNLILSNSIRLAVVGLGKTLANEVSKDGITVNTVCPGWTYTERVEQLITDRAQRQGLSVEQTMAQITNTIPMGRMGRVEEFAAAVAFLACERASYITGAALQVDGGATRGPF